MRFFTVRLLLASISLLLAGCNSLTSPDNHESSPESASVNIAVLLDLTGGQSTLGQPAMNGFLLALQEKASVPNVKFYSGLFNTATDPKTTLTAAQAVINDVPFASGFTNNNSLLVSGPTFQSNGIPFLGIGVTDPSLPSVIGDTIFLAAFGDNAQAAAAAEFAKKKFGSTVAILWDATSEYSTMLPRYFRKRFEELGGKVLLDIPYDGGCDISNLGKQVANMATKPSFIYLAGQPACIGEVVASLRSSGVDLPIIGGDGLDTQNLLKSSGGATDKVWFTTHAWLSKETGTPIAKKFIDAYERAYGVPPADAFAALGYDAATLMLDVLQNVETIEPRQIIQALEKTRGFNGVTGTITFTKELHVPKKTVWIVQIDSGKRALADAFIPQSVPPPIIPAAL